MHNTLFYPLDRGLGIKSRRDSAPRSFDCLNRGLRGSRDNDMYRLGQLFGTACQEFYAIFNVVRNTRLEEVANGNGFGGVQARLRDPGLDFVKVYLLEIDSVSVSAVSTPHIVLPLIIA